MALCYGSPSKQRQCVWKWILYQSSCFLCCWSLNPTKRNKDSELHAQGAVRDSWNKVETTGCWRWSMVFYTRLLIILKYQTSSLSLTWLEHSEKPLRLELILWEWGSTVHLGVEACFSSVKLNLNKVISFPNCSEMQTLWSCGPWGDPIKCIWHKRQRRNYWESQVNDTYIFICKGMIISLPYKRKIGVITPMNGYLIYGKLD